MKKKVFSVIMIVFAIMMLAGLYLWDYSGESDDANLALVDTISAKKFHPMDEAYTYPTVPATVPEENPEQASVPEPEIEISEAEMEKFDPYQQKEAEEPTVDRDKNNPKTRTTKNAQVMVNKGGSVRKGKFQACDWKCPIEIQSIADAKTVSAALSFLGYLPQGHYACNTVDWEPMWLARKQFIEDHNVLHMPMPPNDAFAEVLTNEYRTKNGCSELVLVDNGSFVDPNSRSIMSLQAEYPPFWGEELEEVQKLRDSLIIIREENSIALDNLQELEKHNADINDKLMELQIAWESGDAELIAPFAPKGKKWIVQTNISGQLSTGKVDQTGVFGNQTILGRTKKGSNTYVGINFGMDRQSLRVAPAEKQSRDNALFTYPFIGAQVRSYLPSGKGFVGGELGVSYLLQDSRGYPTARAFGSYDLPQLANMRVQGEGMYLYDSYYEVNVGANIPLFESAMRAGAQFAGLKSEGSQNYMLLGPTLEVPVRSQDGRVTLFANSLFGVNNSNGVINIGIRLDFTSPSLFRQSEFIDPQNPRG